MSNGRVRRGVRVGFSRIDGWPVPKSVIKHGGLAGSSQHVAMKEYLLTAGPTPVPERVLLAMARPVLSHRSPGFTERLRQGQDSLRRLVQPPPLPAVLPAPGTVGMEAA